MMLLPSDDEGRESETASSSRSISCRQVVSEVPFFTLLRFDSHLSCFEGGLNSVGFSPPIKGFSVDFSSGDGAIDVMSLS